MTLLFHGNTEGSAPAATSAVADAQVHVKRYEKKRKYIFKITMKSYLHRACPYYSVHIFPQSVCSTCRSVSSILFLSRGFAICACIPASSAAC